MAEPVQRLQPLTVRSQTENSKMTHVGVRRIVLAFCCTAAFAADAAVIRDVAYDSSIGRFGLGDLFLPAEVNGDTPRLGPLPQGRERPVHDYAPQGRGLAHVFVNGVDCGVAWCAPWEVDVSSAVREGENEVEIRYTNNWYNRLVGDCFLPEGERVTRSTLRYWRHSRKDADDKDRSHRRRRCSGPSADDSLQPSGLLGPAVIRGG